MTLFERVHLPSFAGATEWLNSEPLGPADLRGHVVLVNFWTWTYINWLRHRFHARDAHLVLSPGARESIPFRVLLAAPLRAAPTASTSTRTATACSATAASTS
jgi:hypothetical protein